MTLDNLISRLRISPRLFLAWVVALFAITPAYAQQSAQPGGEPQTDDEQIIQPEVGRRPDKLPSIDTENLEVGVFVGLYSLEDFGAEIQYGSQFGYHVTEDIFFEGALAVAEVSDTTYRNIGLSIFPSEHQTLSYYNLSVGFHLLPGELFLGRNTAYTAQVFLIGGVGNTQIGEEDYFTLNYGLGLRILGNDWFALRLDFRDHVFDTDIVGRKQTYHNLALQTGITLFF